MCALDSKPRYEDIAFLTTILPHQNGVRTYLGRLVDVLGPGPYVGLPKIHKIAKVDMQPSYHSVKMDVVSKDNYGFPMQVDLVVRVSDAGKYMIDAPENVTFGLEEILKAQVGHEITSKFTQEDLKTKREDIGDVLSAALSEKTLLWGVDVGLARIPTIAMPQVSYELEEERLNLIKEGENRLVGLEWTAQAVERETEILTRRLTQLAVTEANLVFYREVREAAALAFATRSVGEAEAAVLLSKSQALNEFMSSSVERLVAQGMSPGDAKELLICSVGLVFGGNGEKDLSSRTEVENSPSDSIREAVVGKMRSRINGEAVRSEADAAGVDVRFSMLMNTFRALSGAGNINLNNWSSILENFSRRNR
jgi:hypothetical protein